MVTKKLIATLNTVAKNPIDGHNILRRYSIDYRRKGWLNTEVFLQNLDPSISNREYKLILTAIWDINHVNIPLLPSIFDKIVSKRNSIDPELLSTILSPSNTSGPQIIHAFKKSVNLSHEEESYIWKIFEQTSPTHFYDRTIDHKGDDLDFDDFADRVKRVLTRNPGSKEVLEIGCGNNGNVIRELANNPKMNISKAHGVALRIDNFPQNEKTTLVEANMNALPFKDHSFDVIFEHKAFIYAVSDEELQQTLSEAMRVLRPGGILLISETNIDKYEKLKTILTLTGNNYSIRKIGISFVIRKNSEDESQNMDYNTDRAIKRTVNAWIQKAVPKKSSLRGKRPE